MQFYKFDGFAVAEKWFVENDNRRAMREMGRKIASKAESFNQKFKKKAFFFVSDASEGTVAIGIICREPLDLGKQINLFLKAIRLELKDTCLEEITFESVRRMLQYAERSDYIRSEDEILEQFNLTPLSERLFRSMPFGENLVEEADKDDIYAEAERFLAKDRLIPELNRIYSGVHAKRVMGHPVHYMIQTDDIDTRKSVYRLLLQALYAKGRLQSKRYCYVDIKPGEDLPKHFYDCLYRSNSGGAMVVRYLANDDPETEFASSGRDTIETLCKMMKKYSNRVLTIFCLPRECASSKEIFYENLGSTSFVELKEEFVSGKRAEDFLRMLARDNKIRTDKKLFAKLKDDESYLAPDLHNIFEEWYNNKLKTGVYPQYKEIASAKKEAVEAKPKGSAYDELMEMVGLEKAKELINNALNYYKAQKLFAEKGMKAERPAMHMIFTGNPGTAKTSVARLFARIMKENGLLSKGHLVEVGREDIVGRFVGWTAPTVKRCFQDAKGGVLFIDEAYSLVDDRDGMFGDEAINTIVKEMENLRDEVVVIFAGYPDKMERFLDTNPGLRSRIAFHVNFEDYNTENLCDIATLMAKKRGLNLTDDARDKLFEIFDIARNKDDFGNGRYVRNVLEKARMAQSTRLLGMDFDSVSKSDIATIRAEDIEMPPAPKEAKRQIGF